MNSAKLKAMYARVSSWALPVLIVVLLFSMKRCGDGAVVVADLQRAVDSVSAQTTFLENRNGDLVAENKTIKITNAAELKKYTDTIFQLKKRDAENVARVTQFARIIQEGKFRDKFARFDTVVVNDTVALVIPGVVDSNYILTPRPFTFYDSTIRFAGRVMRTGVAMDSISIQNTVSFRTAEIKTGFLNLRRETRVQVLNSNPNIQTAGVANITVASRANWWQRWGKPLAAAILAGIAVKSL